MGLVKRAIGQAWLVLILAFGFGGALAGVEMSLKDRIAANRLAKTLDQVPDVVPEATQAGEAIRVAERTAYPALNDAGELVGWVLSAGGQGFADRIQVLVGLDPAAETITGIYVLDQKETPGLGNKIVEADWRDQFRGKPADEPLEVIKQGDPAANEIMSISGATISSESVADIINAAVRAAGSKLATRAQQRTGGNHGG